MKKHDKKDQKLNAIFSKYIDEGKMPSKNVTCAAKDYLNKECVVEESLVPATATTNNHGLNNSLNSSKNNKIIYLVAFIMFAILIAFTSYYFTKKSINSVQGVGLSPISMNDLDKNYENYKTKEFLPFVEEKKVKSYIEYNLKEDTSSYKAGDTVAYFVDYNSSEDVEISLYIEKNGIYLIDLAEYKKANSNVKINDITFFYNFKTDECLYYFNHKNYGYNLIINSSDKTLITNYLTYITDCFNK